MFGRIKTILGITAVLLFAAAGCGSDGGSVKAMINGVEYDLNVEHVLIMSGVGAGSDPNFIGYDASGRSLNIEVGISSGGSYMDRISFWIADVTAVQPGVPVPIDATAANVTVVLGGQTMQVFGGSILFDSLSNLPGGRVDMTFKLDLGGSMMGTIYGNVHGEVQGAY